MMIIANFHLLNACHAPDFILRIECSQQLCEMINQLPPFLNRNPVIFPVNNCELNLGIF